jgi:hypothetical protein
MNDLMRRAIKTAPTGRESVAEILPIHEFSVMWRSAQVASLDPQGHFLEQISKDGCIIHLSEHHGDCSLGAHVRIETDELGFFQKQLLAKQMQVWQSARFRRRATLGTCAGLV